MANKLYKYLLVQPGGIGRVIGLRLAAHHNLTASSDLKSRFSNNLIEGIFPVLLTLTLSIRARSGQTCCGHQISFGSGFAARVDPSIDPLVCAAHLSQHKNCKHNDNDLS